jgi:pSer/pThr/pTyr-binding forkhead associated (FHA) protein
MWLLTEERVAATPADAELQTYTFCAGADGSPSIAGVGRKPRDPAPSAGNIILENQSISRVHAEVHCCAQQKDEAQQKLQVVDKSKFGSFVNGVKIGKGQTVQLKDGDVVLFGTVAKAATFRVQWKPVRILCSSVSSANKNALKKLCPALGGQMLKNWDSRVTHLVQDKIVMTEKAMLALIDGVPIVTHDFFAAALGRTEAKTPLPNPQAFLPEVSQGTTQSVTREDFEVNLQRKTMLEGHLFFFFTDKQHKKHSTVIKQAAGEAVVLRSEPPHAADPVQAELDRRGSSRPDAEKIFFIDVETSSQLSQSMSTDEAEAVATIRQRCAEHGARKVRDTEVLQAILRGQVIAELAEETLSQAPVAAETSPSPPAAKAKQLTAAATAATAVAGAKRPAGDDSERPVPAASRRRTTATQSPKDKPAAAAAAAAPAAAAAAPGDNNDEADELGEIEGASPIVEASPAPVQRDDARSSGRKKADVARGHSGQSRGGRAAAASVSPVPQAGTPGPSPSRSRPRRADKDERSTAAPAASVAKSSALDDNAAAAAAPSSASSAQLDEQLADRIENAPSAASPAARRKAPPLSSTIFSQPARRLGTTPDQRSVHGVNKPGARARNPADRDVIVDDGLLTKDVESSAPPARKNFKRFRKKGSKAGGGGGGGAAARARPVIKMRLHNANDLARAVDRAGMHSDESDDDNNLFDDDVPTNRQPAKRRRAGAGSGVVQRRRGR